jgi:carbon-monoxide dehydrogenase large subunit
MNTSPPEIEHGRFGSGQSVRRIEDPALVTGQGRFVDDCTEPGCASLVLLRSPMAHARIVSIDASAARALPGVLAVVTGQDLIESGVGNFPGPAPHFKRPDGEPVSPPPRRAIAADCVRFVGEAVAAVVAETPDIARAARDAILVDFEELPAVSGLDAALAPDAPQVWPGAPGNVAARSSYGDPAEVGRIFARAPHTVAIDVVNQRLAPSPMEPRAVLASFDATSERLTMRLSNQMPSNTRNALAQILGLPKERIRVVVGDVGGGFGMKTNAYPEEVVAAWASMQLARPVKWVADRTEEFLAAVHGRSLRSRAEMALDATGRVLALRIETLADIGAHVTPSSLAIPLLIGPWVSTSVYDIAPVDISISAVMTNIAPLGAYRGAGRPESIYIIERLMDAAARRLAMDPAEIRRRNLIAPGQMPYRNAMGQTYDSGRFESLLDQALALSDWRGFDRRLEECRAAGRLRGRGVTTFLEWTGANVFEERVTVKVSADGFIEIFTATQAMGQGIATSYAQLAVDIFDVPIERVRIIQGDTDRGEGFGSGGSRSLFTAGSAVREASRQTIEIARGHAADALEVAAADLQYRSGRFEVAGTDLGMGLFEIAARQPESNLFLESRTKVDGPSWPNGCHVCEVEIDPQTGVVVIDRYQSVNDVGRVINPMIVVGQLDGGAVQGIGQALCEQVVYDGSGQLLTASFLDYAMPRAGIVRRFDTRLDQTTPCLTNPLGVKGVGELGTIGATPVVVSAVLDALERVGLGHRVDALQMPLTSEKIWLALQGELPALPSGATR